MLVVDDASVSGWLAPDDVPANLPRDLNGVRIDWCLLPLTRFDRGDVAGFTASAARLC